MRYFKPIRRHRTSRCSRSLRFQRENTDTQDACATSNPDSAIARRAAVVAYASSVRMQMAGNSGELPLPFCYRASCALKSACSGPGRSLVVLDVCRSPRGACGVSACGGLIPTGSYRHLKCVRALASEHATGADGAATPPRSPNSPRFIARTYLSGSRVRGPGAFHLRAIVGVPHLCGPILAPRPPKGGTPTGHLPSRVSR